MVDPHLLDDRRSSRRASALPAEERRSMIVAATIDLLVEQGEMVTTRQIADAAGIAEGTIFRVFPDKDALIAAAIDTALDPAPLEEALRRIDPDLAFPARLEAAVTLIQQRVTDVWRLASSVGARFHERARGPIAESDALTELMAAGRPQLRVAPEVAARLLRALTMSTTHPMLVAEAMPAPEVIDLFLHGVARRPTC